MQKVRQSSLSLDLAQSNAPQIDMTDYIYMKKWTAVIPMGGGALGPFLFFSPLPPANTHTHRTSTQHTHKKHRPSLWVGITIRYRRPLRCRVLDCPGSAAGVERQAETF